MPSAALIRWQTERMSRLGYVDVHCAGLFASSPLAPPGSSASSVPLPAPSPLAQESLQGYVMLLSGHFQGFCRDLYTESSQVCAATVPAGLKPTIQAQFAAGLKLNTGNPTVDNIRKDFQRFGFLVDLRKCRSGERCQDDSPRTLELLAKYRRPSKGDFGSGRRPRGPCSV